MAWGPFEVLQGERFDRGERGVQAPLGAPYGLTIGPKHCVSRMAFLKLGLLELSTSKMDSTVENVWIPYQFTAIVML